MSDRAAPAARDVEALLTAATEQNETWTIERLMDELGTSESDVAEALDQLRSVGKAMEDTPGEWRGPYEYERRSEVGEPGPVTVTVSEDDGEPGETFVRDTFTGRPGTRLEEHAGEYGAVWEGVVESQPVSARLTRGMATALGAEALGALVQAGIEETPEGQPFTLEVL